MTIVAVYAHDWGCYCEQVDADYKFDLIYGWIIGKLIMENDDMIVLAHHWFDRENQVRHVTTVQKSCVIRRQDFEVDTNAQPDRPSP